jgi:hypothetical protein
MFVVIIVIIIIVNVCYSYCYFMFVCLIAFSYVLRAFVNLVRVFAFRRRFCAFTYCILYVFILYVFRTLVP